MGVNKSHLPTHESIITQITITITSNYACDYKQTLQTAWYHDMFRDMQRYECMRVLYVPTDRTPESQTIMNLTTMLKRNDRK